MREASLVLEGKSVCVEPRIEIRARTGFGLADHFAAPLPQLRKREFAWFDLVSRIRDQAAAREHRGRHVLDHHKGHGDQRECDEGQLDAFAQECARGLQHAGADAEPSREAGLFSYW